MYVGFSNLEQKLIFKVADRLYADCNSEIISKEDVLDVKQAIITASNKFDICSALETLYYCFSVILSEVRQRKRETITAIFEQDKKIAEEKKALEKKLDSFPEYAELHRQEESIFQLLEHLNNIKTYINWLSEESV